MRETTPVDTSAEHIKRLEDELLKLRIENAYLKELRRLRLEEETLLKKQRESSTVSEENLNGKRFSRYLVFRKQPICIGKSDLTGRIGIRRWKIRFESFMKGIRTLDTEKCRVFCENWVIM